MGAVRLDLASLRPNPLDRGMAAFTAASLACALAGSISLLDGARAVQGIGAAMLFAGSLAILADAFREPAERAGC